MRKCIVFLLSLCACTVQAQQFTNGQAARAVVGQLQFSFGTNGTQQNLLGGASGVAYGNGLLFVADGNRVAATPQNNRVLVFGTDQIPGLHADPSQMLSPSSACGLCGYSAIGVLGQADYITNTPGRNSTATPSVGGAAGTGYMSTPTAVATDGHILAVADTDNNRVLIWNSIPANSSSPPNVVLGQKDFTSFQTPQVINSNSLRGPQGVWIQNGKLFVADTQNYRILIWNHIPAANNQAADLVLGQPDFTHANSPPVTKTNPVAAANQLLNPVSVTSDGTHVFVADLGFNRVLIWNSIPTAMDQPADVEIGQPDMTGTVANNNTAECASNGTDSNGNATFPFECEGTLNYPRFALSDGTRLFVADGGNDRVLIYNSIPTSNGAKANEVLGQPDFFSNVNTNQTASIISTTVDNTGSVDTIPSPMSLAWDGTNLYVGDPFNRRVLIFTPGDTSLPDNSVVNWASEIVRQEGIVTISLAAGGAITAGDTVTITLGNASAGTTQNYTYTVKTNDTLDAIAKGLVTLINANGGDANATAIFAGTGTGSVYLSSKAVNLPFDSISLAATASSGGINETAIASGAYLSAGTAATAAPGMLVEVNGTNLSDQPSANPITALPAGTLPTAGVPLPTQLGGAQVFMDGFAVPLLSVSNTQIVAQVPYTFTNGTFTNTSNTSPNSQGDRNSTSIFVRTVHSGGNVTVTNATTAFIAPANPGLFNQASYAGQPPPRPVIGALHQAGNPNAVVSIDGSVHAGDTATITVNGVNYTYTVLSTDSSLANIVQGLVNLINGKPDPLVTASAGQAFTRVVLTAIQPGAAGSGISIAGSASANANVVVTAYTSATCCAVSPGPITASNPAAPGETITVAATGLGQLSDSTIQVVAGQPYNGPAGNTAANSVVATMNGETAQVIAAGLPQGSTGVYRIQLIVPSDLPSNINTQLYVAQNAFISNTVTIPVGTASLVTPPTAPASPIRINIDIPGSQNPAFTGTATFGGWAIDNNAAITSVNVSIDGISYGGAVYGASRPDVCNSYPGVAGCPNVGWTFSFDTTGLADGSHTVQITANGADGLHFTVAGSFSTANFSSNLPTRLNIDLPGPQSNPFQGLVSLTGWALNDNAAISNVAVTIDGTSIGKANYGAARPDVCNTYPGRPGCVNVGWSTLLDTNTLSNGAHTISVVATATNGQHAATSRSFTVANWSSANPMHINIDAPGANSGAFNGNVVFGGWAIDDDSAIGSVQISIDGVSFGNATYGVNRPDVCSAYPGKAGCPNVGWNFSLDTTQLADGSHTLGVTAITVIGQRSTVTSTFTVANFTGSNPMRVYIDIPASQSAPLSGTASLAGWAISDKAAISGVQILVDGVARGNAIYGIGRPDVCAAFSGRAGCPNVGWTASLDTTLLANGTHILEVTATSALPNLVQQGTTSRSFTVANSNSNGPTRIIVDTPNSQSNPFEGLASLSGWAIDDTAAITQVAISVDGAPAGNATYGTPRADVCNTYPGKAGCPNVGWFILLDTTQLADGTHTLGVTAYTSSGTHSTANASFTVANWSTPNPTMITIDSPVANSTIFGAVGFGGWAIDTNGPIGSVSISVDGVSYGAATYGVSRPDVCFANPGRAGCPNVGWSLTFNTTLLANGAHTIAVTATTPYGQSSTVTQSFTVAN